MSSFITKIKKVVKKPFTTLAKYVKNNPIISFSFLFSTVFSLFLLSPSSTFTSILFSSAYGISHVLFYVLLFVFCKQNLNLLFRFLRFKFKTQKGNNSQSTKVSSVSHQDMSSTLEILSKFEDKDPNLTKLKDKLSKLHKKEEAHS